MLSNRVVVNDKLYHIFVVNLINSVTWRFDSPDTMDAYHLATTLFRGLRNRSRYALVVSSGNGTKLTLPNENLIDIQIRKMYNLELK